MVKAGSSMNQKTYMAWLSTIKWCECNPGKKAAIVTPDGVFEMTFTSDKTKRESSFLCDGYDTVSALGSRGPQ